MKPQLLEQFPFGFNSPPPASHADYVAALSEELGEINYAKQASRQRAYDAWYGTGKEPVDQLPIPVAGETERDFMKRCDLGLKFEYPDETQRTDVCHQQWSKSQCQSD